MKKVFLAYFDLLGYKDFILNNTNDQLMVRMGHIFRDIEFALGKGEYKEQRPGVLISDISQSKIHAINISDTIIFWTTDCSYDNFLELLEVAYKFNSREVNYFFPLRGTILCDEIHAIIDEQKSNTGGTYNLSILFGKGIVNAHLKSENQSWSGTVIDQSVIEEASKHNDPIPILNKYSKLYLVPYKNSLENQKEEYALKLVEKSLDIEAYQNVKNNIERTFALDNKRVDSPRVQEIMRNTIKFLDTFKE